MLKLIKKSLVVICVLVSFTAYSQLPNNGQWRAELHYDSVNVPFTFQWLINEQDTSFTIVNGDERKGLKEIQISGDSLLVKLTPFDAALKLKFTESTMTGEWVKFYRDSHVLLTANFNKQRFNLNKAGDENKLAAQWNMELSPSRGQPYKGVGLWQQDGNRVTGTIMTDVSDYRYFEGVITNDSIKLSSFDGVHGFLLLGKKEGAQWEGDIHFNNGYKESWVAKADEGAELPDPWHVVNVSPGEHRPFFDILAAGSAKGHIDESEYFDQVLVIQLFGTWCPNSLDETNFLKDWYANHKDWPVKILGVSYEANYSEAYGLKRLDDYRKDLNIPYDLKLGGQLNKGQAALAFPFIDKIQAFPTLVIVDKMGYVRYVHSYFNGPATGDYYKEFKNKFNTIIEELVNE